MGWFTKWYKMYAFDRRGGIEDPVVMLQELQRWSPACVQKDHFSWQRRRDNTVLGWVYFERRKDARAFNRFLKRSPIYDFVSEGEVNSECLDSIQWGL